MFRRAVISAVFAVGLIAPEMAHAQRQGPDQRLGENVGRAATEQQQAARRGVEAGQYVPMPQVQAALNRRTPGKIQDSNLGNIGDRPVYRVRWETSDGKRINYVIDARTGAIISQSGG